MADNVTADPGTGGAVFATDDIASVHYPRTKITLGADGVTDGDVSSANPMPVTGTVAVTNAGLTELAAAINASSQMDVNIAASGVTVPVSLTSTTVTGTVAVTQSGTWDEVGINDSGNSITVDAPVGTPVFVRLSDGAAAIATLPVSLASVPSHAVTNAGTFAVQVDGSALTALQVIDNPVVVDDAAFTPATTSVMVAGFQADETSTDSVDEGDAGAARMTLDRKVITTPQPHTAGGLSIFKTLDLDETEEEAKGTAGQVYGWSITNFSTAVRHIKFYNATAANVTVGTTTPVMTISVPGNATDDTQSVMNLGGMGIAFDTAITVAATTGLADNDTGAPGANDVSLMLFYK